MRATRSSDKLAIYGQTLSNGDDYGATKGKVTNCDETTGSFHPGS
jgi:hypothetical protein